jgi:hypothetical protein
MPRHPNQYREVFANNGQIVYIRCHTNNNIPDKYAIFDPGAPGNGLFKSILNTGELGLEFTGLSTFASHCAGRPLNGWVTCKYKLNQDGDWLSIP